MPRQSEPEMHDPKDKELHTEEGVQPYPVPNKSKVEGQPQSDEPAGKDYERGHDKDGQYEGGVDRMRNKLKDDGDKDAWSAGRTQGKPQRKS